MAAKKILLIIFPAVFLGLSYSAHAQSAINCHCFKEREYKPADRFAADDYILATNFNSLLAKYFAISKGQIIMLKMNQGVGQDDLVIGLKVAGAAGEDINKILQFRRAGKAWPEIITGFGQQGKAGSDPLLAQIISGMSDEQAGASIADAIIGQFYTVPVEEIDALRKAGLNEKEISLLFILSHVSGREPATLLKQRRQQNESWSEIAHNLGVEPAAAGKLVLAYPAKQITE